MVTAVFTPLLQIKLTPDVVEVALRVAVELVQVMNWSKPASAVGGVVLSATITWSTAIHPFEPSVTVTL